MRSEHEGGGHRGSLRYQVRLLIKHPNMDPAQITARIGISPDNFWKSGEKRTTPSGTPLKGVYEESMWSYSFLVYGNRLFSRYIIKMIDTIEANASYFSGLIDGRGSIEIIVNLPGDVNIGDSISSDDLSRLAKHGTKIGFEVFPDFPR